MQSKVRQARARPKKVETENAPEITSEAPQNAAKSICSDQPPSLVCVDKTDNYDIFIGNSKSQPKNQLTFPFKIKPSELYKSLAQYYENAKENPQLLDYIKTLGGKVLGCSCPENVTCHGHVIIYLWKELMLPTPSKELAVTWLDGHLNNPPLIEYIENWIQNPADVFNLMEKEVDFEMRSSTFGEKTLRDNRATCHFTRNLQEMDVSVHTETSTVIPPTLLELIERLERAYPDWEITRILCNRYGNGLQGIGWHSDREEIGHGPIFSVSLGNEREKQFKLLKDDNVTISKVLKPGALVIMWPPCQQVFRHSIPKDVSAFLPRINITLRTSKRTNPL